MGFFSTNKKPRSIYRALSPLKISIDGAKSPFLGLIDLNLDLVMVVIIAIGSSSCWLIGVASFIIPFQVPLGNIDTSLQLAIFAAALALVVGLAPAEGPTSYAATGILGLPPTCLAHAAALAPRARGPGRRRPALAERPCNQPMGSLMSAASMPSLSLRAVGGVPAGLGGDFAYGDYAWTGWPRPATQPARCRLASVLGPWPGAASTTGEAPEP